VRQILVSLIKESNHQAKGQGQGSVRPYPFRVGSHQSSEPKNCENAIVKEMKRLAKIPVDRGEGLGIHGDYPGYHPIENFEGVIG